jgi:class 3 adenylate cyclase
VIAFLRLARRALPGDPSFGDRLSATGSGGPETAARAAEQLLGYDDAASRELSMATLQVWQAIRERSSGRPAHEEITLVFTDLVGFSEWALQAGDDAMLRLLRRVAQVVEPPLRVGIHTGQPHRIGSDWLGTDVNIAARVMECTDKGEVLISGATLQRLTPEQLDELGIHAKRVRHAMFAHQPTGVPDDFAIYRLETRTH